MASGKHADKHTESLSLADAEAICTAKGERLTPRRRRVLEIILTSTQPITAYEILDLLKPEDARASAVAVYRSLDFLMEAGLVHRIETTRAFIGCAHPGHKHGGQFLICRRCGTVVETEDTNVIHAAEALGQKMGFSLEAPMVEVTGVCGNCGAQNAH